MNVRVRTGNYRNDALMLGFSDLNKLKTERPLIFTRGKGIFIYDENGKDYIETVWGRGYLLREPQEVKAKMSA